MNKQPIFLWKAFGKSSRPNPRNGFTQTGRRALLRRASGITRAKYGKRTTSPVTNSITIMGRKLELEGQRFGRLVALDRTGKDVTGTYSGFAAATAGITQSQPGFISSQGILARAAVYRSMPPVRLAMSSSGYSSSEITNIPDVQGSRSPTPELRRT